MNGDRIRTTHLGFTTPESTYVMPRPIAKRTGSGLVIGHALDPMGRPNMVRPILSPELRRSALYD
jgi:hypothetical protein